ncbi:AraC family transcriptional regulator [Thauera sp. Sel9]|uniref:AraC family transcriptional regulator n=1 Tax=Thauera sp. Sel9 TaxID=2974299 RepID=UPI0021E19826|nr:AraC family transcriptional regulator [Thauera sp. Sel9]MCV2218714.1 AraC family transcriptional regulator [Thauera sp. Sel9]
MRKAGVSAMDGLEASARMGRIGAIADTASTATVSFHFVQDLLQSLRSICAEPVLDRCLKQAGIAKEFIEHPGSRLTHDQLVRLYQESASATGDEMMGLWSRPIRAGALKYIVRAVMDASTISVALHRFTQVWNLLLDDYRLHLSQADNAISLALLPRSPKAVVNRFGHALMLKLTHGIVSWLVGHEVPVQRVSFVFPRPLFAADYPILFPAPIDFEGPFSQIIFDAELGSIRAERNASDVRMFLQRAPRDWIFTSYHEHTMRLKVRELLYADLGRTLEDVSGKLHMSSRTLIRRLQDEGLSFQGIKDELRRDLAILNLAHQDVSLAEISYSLGFSSPAVFHRAFRCWTGMTPGVYRVAQQKLRGSDLEPRG